MELMVHREISVQSITDTSIELTGYDHIIHPSIRPLSVPAYPEQGAGAYPSVHWARGRNTPWTGRQSIAGHTHHSLTHSYLWAI
uniref:Uncharacterized protein n=1 Tax=Anguilla anguilla TaxID=7936 RepID=A0A0E9W860_ANGAN